MSPLVRPPIAPMLARLERALPVGALTYEPKWDGFRCIAFVRPDSVELQSRHGRPLARYFPEIVAAFGQLLGRRTASGLGPIVLDGEILLAADAPTGPVPPFARLMARLHPAASRVDVLSRQDPARYVAFDVLADGEADLRRAPFVDRRARLVEALRSAPAGIEVTPASRDATVAQRWLDGAPDPAIDGVVAKPDDLPYEPGRRSMIKVKLERTADCVVAGMRLSTPRSVSSLVLGLYDGNRDLRHVGVVTQFRKEERSTAFERLRPLVLPIHAHPWRGGFAIGASLLGRLKGSAARWTPDMPLDWVPLEPTEVVEVAYDRVDVDRFRHPAHLVRWRADRDAGSCSLDQILDDRTAAVARADAGRRASRD